MTHPGRTQNTDIVAFLLGYLPRPLEPFSSLMINGMLNRLNEYHKHLLVLGSPYYPSIADFSEVVLSKPVEGLLLIPSFPEINQRLLEAGLPLVAVADRAPGLVSVVVDSEMGAYMLAEHLSLRGHRRVLYRKDINAHESAVLRFNAFEKAAEYLGLELASTLPADQGGNLSAEEEKILLNPASRPSAVVTWGDTYAYPVLKFCRAHGLRIPQDLAVAGFDGIPYPIEPACKLTTIQAPWIRVAEVAVDVLVRQMRGEDVPRETVLPVDLSIGDTT